MFDLIWPQACVGCGARHQGRLCAACTPQEAEVLGLEMECVRGGWGVVPYRSGVGQAVRVAKYRPDRGLMYYLGGLLADRLLPQIEEVGFQAVVPAPSPWTRRVGRGFASAAILADVLSRRMKIPLYHALWVRRGLGQAGLSGAARRSNLAGRVRAKRAVSGRVLVVDDVLTTGSTVSACARELLGEGADEVFVGVLCVVDGGRPRPMTGLCDIVPNPETSDARMFEEVSRPPSSGGP